MGSSFRIALGDCSAKDRNDRHRGVARQGCELVISRIDQLKALSGQQLFELPAESQEIVWFDSKRVELNTIHQLLDDNSRLFVV